MAPSFLKAEASSCAVLSGHVWNPAGRSRLLRVGTSLMWDANLMTLVHPPAFPSSSVDCGGVGGLGPGSSMAPTRFAQTALRQRRVLLWPFFSPLFICFLFLFVFSLFPLSPFCSRDAAKRKAWKLNRVGSLRNIYSSSTNTEGNASTPPPAHTSTCLFPPHPLPAPSLSTQAWKCNLPTAACSLIVFAESFLWSFHLFVCVFYFTIHVPFSLLKFWPFPSVVE